MSGVIELGPAGTGTRTREGQTVVQAFCRWRGFADGRAGSLVVCIGPRSGAACSVRPRTGSAGRAGAGSHLCVGAAVVAGYGVRH